MLLWSQLVVHTKMQSGWFSSVLDLHIPAFCSKGSQKSPYQTLIVVTKSAFYQCPPSLGPEARHWDWPSLHHSDLIQFKKVTLALPSEGKPGHFQAFLLGPGHCVDSSLYFRLPAMKTQNLSPCVGGCIALVSVSVQTSYFLVYN